MSELSKAEIDATFFSMVDVRNTYPEEIASLGEDEVHPMYAKLESLGYKHQEILEMLGFEE